MYKNTPPQKVFCKKDQYRPDVGTFLLELRTEVLNMTIEQFISCLDWNNEKYYQQIVNGYRVNGKLQYKKPTIDIIFTGLNYAMNNSKKFKSKEKEIKDLIYKYLLKF